MSALPLFFAMPLLAAGIAAVVPSTAGRRAIGIGATLAVLLGGVWLVARTGDGTVLAAPVAGWPAGVAIPFAADPLSSLMLLVSSVLVLASLVFASATGADRDPWFVPLTLILTAGVYGAYLTVDLFNLFVMIEVALLPSYALMARRQPGAAAAARRYLVVNLTASTIFLVGIGAVYGVTGTVNIAALVGAGRQPLVATALAIILIALAVKAALVPVHTWLPNTYPATGLAVTALFSGLLTKIGVYALIRLVSVVYEPGTATTVVVVAVTAASMVVGVLGALGEQTVRGVLAFHMVSQAGYILVGIVLAGPLGLAAAVFYLAHHTVVKTSLFLSCGAVEHRRGTGVIARLGGVAEEHRWVSLGFFLAALSLTGLPPMSGFWAKLGVLRASLDAGQGLVYAVALVVSVGTLMSMLKLGTGVFWGPAPAGSQQQPAAAWGPGLVLPGLLLALASLGIGLYPEPLLALAAAAGDVLADPEGYARAVLGR